MHMAAARPGLQCLFFQRRAAMTAGRTPEHARALFVTMPVANDCAIVPLLLAPDRTDRTVICRTLRPLRC
jgi:hypothetical protein